jgi:hypothetical protein
MSALPLLLAAQEAASKVGSGRIQGGWEFIWAAYGITWAALSLYALSLWLRRPKGDISKEQP